MRIFRVTFLLLAFSCSFYNECLKSISIFQNTLLMGTFSCSVEGKDSNLLQCLVIWDQSSHFPWCVAICVILFILCNSLVLLARFSLTLSSFLSSPSCFFHAEEIVVCKLGQKFFCVFSLFTVLMNCSVDIHRTNLLYRGEL